MNHYLIKEETYKAYEYLIDIFKHNNLNLNLKHSSATAEENEILIANEIYKYFGTHYFKCINSLNEMRNKTEYINIIENVDKINILDIGCNVGTATYSYIDTYLETKDENDICYINVVFIEVSKIRVNLLEKMFEKYISEINKAIEFIPQGVLDNKLYFL